MTDGRASISWNAIARAVDDDPEPLIDLCIQATHLIEGQGRPRRNGDWRWRPTDSLAFFRRSRRGMPAFKDFLSDQFSPILKRSQELGIDLAEIADAYRGSPHLNTELTRAERVRYAREAQARRERQAKEAEAKIRAEFPAQTLERLVREAIPAESNGIAALYALNRGGIRLDGLLFHKAPRYMERGRLVQLRSSLIAPFTDKDGALCALQFIQLTELGTKAAPRWEKEPIKRSFGAIGQGFCRIGPKGAKHVKEAEGIETGATILMACPDERILIAAGAPRIPPADDPDIESADTITLCLDCFDKSPGDGLSPSEIDEAEHKERQAEARQEALKQKARQHQKREAFRFVMPADRKTVRDGFDFNDLHQENGIEAVRTAVAAAEPLRDLAPILGAETERLPLCEAEKALREEAERIKTEILTPLLIRKRAKAVADEEKDRIAKRYGWQNVGNDELTPDELRLKRRLYGQATRDAKAKVWAHHGYERPLPNHHFESLSTWLVDLGLGKTTTVLRLLASLEGQSPDILNGHELNFGDLRVVYLTQSQKQMQHRLNEFVDFGGDPDRCGLLLGRDRTNPRGVTLDDELFDKGLSPLTFASDAQRREHQRAEGKARLAFEDVLNITKMCLRRGVTELAARAMWSMQNCRACPISKAGACPYASQFSVLRQKNVLFAAHAYSSIGFSERVGAVDMVVVDEYASLGKERTIAPSLLDVDYLTEKIRDMNERAAMRSALDLVIPKIREGFSITEREQDDRSSISRLNYQAWTADDAMAGRIRDVLSLMDELHKRTKPQGNSTTDEMMSALADQQTAALGQIRPLLSTIRAELTIGRLQSQAVIRRQRLAPGESHDLIYDEISVYKKDKPKLRMDMPILYLDGTGSSEAGSLSLGREATSTTKIMAEHQVSITVIPKRCSDRQLIGDDDDAATLRKDVASFATGFANGKEMLMTSTKKARNGLAAELSDNAICAHLGNLRSDNDKQRPITVSTGTNHVPYYRIELAVAGMLAHTDQPPVSTIHDLRELDKANIERAKDGGPPYHPIRWNIDGYPERRVAVELIDGRFKDVWIQYHPDPRCEKLRFQATAGEHYQAIGRSRDLRNPDAQLLSIGQIVYPGYKHDYLPVQRLMQGVPHRFRWEHYAARGNVITLSPTHAADAIKMDDGAPMWPSAEAARAELTRWLASLGLRFDGIKGNFEKIRNFEDQAPFGRRLLGVEGEVYIGIYQIDGGRRPSFCLMGPGGSFADLEQQIGRPVTPIGQREIKLKDVRDQHHAWVDLEALVRFEPADREPADVDDLDEALQAAVESGALFDHERDAILDGLEQHIEIVPSIDLKWRSHQRR